TVDEEAGGPAEDAPVKDDPPLPDLEDLPEAMDTDAPVLGDVEGSGADEAAEEDVKGHVVNDFGVDLLPAGAPTGDVHRADEGEEEHQAIAEHLDVYAGDLEQDLPHASSRPSRSIGVRFRLQVAWRGASIRSHSFQSFESGNDLSMMLTHVPGQTDHLRDPNPIKQLDYQNSE